MLLVSVEWVKGECHILGEVCGMFVSLGCVWFVLPGVSLGNQPLATPASLLHFMSPSLGFILTQTASSYHAIVMYIYTLLTLTIMNIDTAIICNGPEIYFFFF